MEKKISLDVNNQNHKLIIAGLAGMVEDDGLSPREAFQVVEEIKRNIFHALNELKQESVLGRRS